jgi:bifunctional non-homologous end joining protein LigD
MPAGRLSSYRAKRDFGATPEPAGRDRAAGGAPAPRFVVQEHHASHLHWDLRLEREGALASWALPHGLPVDPAERRSAIRTEDHPLEYLSFSGEIPVGSYGAGTMTIWDHGCYEPQEWTKRKVDVVLHGERLRGRYALFALGEGEHWLIHRVDPPEDPDWRPLPARLPPMMARTVGADWRAKPDGGWAVEIKWDGVRALAYCHPGRLRLESRNGREITSSYPELGALSGQLGMREVLLDGEIVAFGADGRPSFQALARRMHLTSPSAVRRLASEVPVVYAIFDLLHLDGHSLLDRRWEERRVLLEALALEGRAWRVPAAERGEPAALIDATRAQGLEGVIAKRVDSRYEPGRRSGAWVKLKHRRRQELVIGGWLPGEGRREGRIGALLLGYHVPGEPALRFAGRVGSGFSERGLDELDRRLCELRRERSPFAPEGACRIPRPARFVAPVLVAEVEFAEWTVDGLLRAPSFKGLRDDIDPAAVVREPDALASEQADGPLTRVRRLPAGELEAIVDGRRLKLTNTDKVLYPATGFTKGDLINYYARIAPAILPHLHDRALTLKRYPNGVQEQFFFEKQAPSHRPEWVATAAVGEIRYVLCQDRPTLVWLANLAALELHAPLARAGAPARASTLAFDLDPGEPAGLLECCEVGLVLRGLFEQLGLRAFAKTSGAKGLHLYVPLGDGVDFDLTKAFARQIAELLERRLGELIVSRMTRSLRAGRVLVDWSQNDRHKTTVAPYSLRATDRPLVSAPVRWEEVERCLREREPELLRLAPEQVLERWERNGDEFAEVATLQQRLPEGV